MIKKGKYIAIVIRCTSTNTQWRNKNKRPFVFLSIPRSLNESKNDYLVNK